MLLTAAIWVLPLPVLDAMASEKDQVDHPACRFCGTDRRESARSRTVIIYGDGTIVGTCTLRCAAIDLYLKTNKIPLSLLVADCNTGRLIDAETAHWVTGSAKPGATTGRARRAFASGEDARAFVAAHGGTPGAFPGVFRAAFEDLCRDLGMTRAKKKKRKKDSREMFQNNAGPGRHHRPAAPAVSRCR